MEKALKELWCKSNGKIVDVTAMNRDYFLKHLWFRTNTIASLFRDGKTYFLMIKHGGKDAEPFTYQKVIFASKKDLLAFLHALKSVVSSEAL